MRCLVMRSAARIRRDGDARGALDVVVERGSRCAVALEQTEGVVLVEVLPLQERLREDVAHAAHERFDEARRTPRRAAASAR